MTGAVLLAAVFGPALAAGTVVLASSTRGPLPAIAGRISAAVAITAFLLALWVAGAVARGGPVDATTQTLAADWPVGAYANQLGVLLLLLVTGVSAVVQTFAVRYLRGDRQAGRFAVLAGVLTSATAATVTAPTLVACAVAWTVASLAVTGLAGLYGDRAAQAGVRLTARALTISDASLWLAVLVATMAWGSIDLRDLAGRAPDFAAAPVTTAVVACLVTCAAIGRSALVPLHGWLTATLAAPTPVSALLHAGVVNGGGMLLITLSPLVGASALATHLAFGIGAITLIVGTTLMLVRPDVKGALALSTVGQMGFMVMTCGLGAYAAAAFHLVAHGMYKASLFLNSGAAVALQIGHRQAPVPAMSTRISATRAAQAVGVPSLGLLAATALLPPVESAEAHGAAALLVFAWVTATTTGWRWLSLHPGARGRVVHATVTTGALIAYVAGLHAVSAALAPALVGAGTRGVTPWLLLPVVAILAALSLVRRPARSERHARAQRALYVAALNAGGPRPARAHVRLSPPATSGAAPLLPQGSQR